MLAAVEPVSRSPGRRVASVPHPVALAAAAMIHLPPTDHPTPTPTMTTYRIEYFDHSGLLREAYAAGHSAVDAMAKVAACEPRVLRITRALPR